MQCTGVQTFPVPVTPNGSIARGTHWGWQAHEKGIDQLPVLLVGMVAVWMVPRTGR